MFKTALILAGLFLTSCSAIDNKENKPNVILIITDDQGHGDLSCHGNPVLKTPHLDKLHSESYRFTDYHVSPTCSPTRGALMSGHYTNRCGPWHTIMGRSSLYKEEKTLGEVFKESGYETGMFGKWHLGDNYPYRPEDRGFTEVVRHGGGGIGQTPDYWDNSYFDDTYWHNKTPKKYKGYCTDIFFSEAKRFIKESQDKGKPFFAYISTNAPHGPWVCPEKYWKSYIPLLAKHGKGQDKIAVFLGMIANIDENVGSLREFLKENNIDDNTIFIFTTDNGTAGGARVFNSAMRGQKGSEYEGGHRVPLFVHWKNGGLTTGTDINQLTAHIDILPTLIEICGLKPLAEDYKVDGKSLMPLISNPKSEWSERTIITDSQRVRDPIKWRKSATMTSRWRLINGEELYDIKADPSQKNNVAEKFPEVVKKLRADYDKWWESLQPAFKKESRIHVGNDAENPATLTAHDWLTSGSYPPWNQRSIRNGSITNGVWSLNIEKSGKYKIYLRRWPRESKLKLHDSVEKGAKVPGLWSYREVEGKALNIQKAGIKIGTVDQVKEITKNINECSFEVELKAGEVHFEGYFILGNGNKVGSYYAYVEKL